MILALFPLVLALVIAVYLIINRAVSKKPFAEWQKILLIVCIVVVIFSALFILFVLPVSSREGTLTVINY
jgi:hypothetical protein